MRRFCCPQLLALPASACGIQEASHPFPVAPWLVESPLLVSDFPWPANPVPWPPLEPLGGSWEWWDQVTVSLVCPSSGVIGEAAVGKHRHEIYSQSPSKLHIPPANDQNTLASVSRGGNLEKCQTFLITHKLLFKERLKIFLIAHKVLSKRLSETFFFISLAICLYVLLFFSPK